jgi:hypothetical protein
MTDPSRKPDVESDLNRYPIPRLLYYLFKREFLGELHISKEKSFSGRVFFREGLPIHTDLPSSRDVLGRVLLERGVITEDAFNKSLQELATTRQLQGQILLRLRAIDQRSLVEGLKLQLSRKLNRLFAVTEAQIALYSGEHGVGTSGEGAQVHADPLRLIYQGVRNNLDAERMKPELEKLHGLLVRLRPGFERLHTRYGIGEEEHGLLALLGRSALPVDQIYRVSNIGLIETQMLIYTLWVTEALETSVAPRGMTSPSQRAVAPPPPAPSVAPYVPPPPPLVQQQQVVPPPAPFVSAPPRMSPLDAPAASSQDPDHDTAPGVEALAQAFSGEILIPEDTGPSLDETSPNAPILIPDIVPAPFDSAPILIPADSSPLITDLGGPLIPPPDLGGPLIPPPDLGGPLITPAPDLGGPFIPPPLVSTEPLTTPAILVPPPLEDLAPGAIPPSLDLLAPGIVPPPLDAVASGAIPPPLGVVTPDPAVTRLKRSSIEAIVLGGPAAPAAPTAPRPSRPSQMAPAAGGPLARGQRPTGLQVSAASAAEHSALITKAFERIKDQNHFEVLELGRTASAELVRETYFKLAKTFHPDRCNALGLAPLIPLAEEVFRRINEAHTVLTNPEARKVYEEELDGKDRRGEVHAALEAEFVFQKGVVFFRKKNFAEALRHFQESYQLNEKEGEHLAWVAWTMFNDPHNDKSKILPKCKELSLKSIKLSPQNATCHYYLGEIYLAMGDDKRAKTCFSRVVELQEHHVEANRHLRLMQMRKDKAQKNKSIFDRLRKK